MENVDKVKNFEQKQQALTVIWLFVQLFVIGFLVSAFSVVGSAQFGALKFAAVWVLLLAIGMTWFGTQTLRKFRSDLAIGSLIGAAFFMAQIFLILAVFAGEDAALEAGSLTAAPASEKATGAFSALLFVSYSAFALLLNCWKADIVKGPGGLSAQGNGFDATLQ